MDNNFLILVDEDDQEIGSAEKLAAHQGPNFKHRAFSHFLFNRSGEVFVQQRAAGKMLWPLHWSNSCCSHPRVGESMDAAVVRRVHEELGIKIDSSPSFLYKFSYFEPYESIGFENELCHVYYSISDQEPAINNDEIARGQFVHHSMISRRFFESDCSVTPWFRMEWKNIVENHLAQIMNDSNFS